MIKWGNDVVYQRNLEFQGVIGPEGMIINCSFKVYVTIGMLHYQVLTHRAHIYTWIENNNNKTKQKLTKKKVFKWVPGKWASAMLFQIAWNNRKMTWETDTGTILVLPLLSCIILETLLFYDTLLFLIKFLQQLRCLRIIMRIKKKR